MATHPNKTFTPARHSPALAAQLMLAATFFIAASTLMAKIAGTDTLGEPLHPVQVSHGRFLFGALAVGVVAIARGVGPRTANLKVHLGRAGFGFAGVTCMFTAVALIPLADATAISFLNPVFAMLFAIPVLGERVGRWRWAAAAIAFLGAIVLLRPGAGAIAPGALFALGAALFLGLEIVVLKRLSGREGPLKIILINNLIALVFASIAVAWVWQWPTFGQVLALAGVGVFMVCAQAFFVNAVARSEASFVVPFSYATLLFATLFDLIAFQVWPDAVSGLGAMMIIGAGIVLAWREGRAKAWRVRA